ncbi:uncharacterized protein PG998_008855 [Apiospora kogelbergensis]|uniref:uncharacterized protein n=1 Tax=Apiospora kogelbergensis TaxID=1337665 RepID=UPI00312EF50B
MGFSSDSIFKTAQEVFRATLSTKDQARYAACDTPAELVQSLQNLEALTRQGQKRKLNRCLKVVEKLNTRLQIYFDALNVIAGVDDTAALAYGAVRIVLQLAAALPTFFDRLLSAISRLTDTFPQYEVIVSIFDGSPSLRMRQHLEKVYQDLFEFLRVSTKVFTASSGRIKRPVEMIANAIWKPFDATFSDILARMDYHRVFILEELEILQAQRSKDADRAASLERAYAEKERLRAEENRRKTEELKDITERMKQAQESEIKESSVRRIKEWLAAPLFAETLESSQEHRIENTAQWIFERDEFTKWTSMEVDARGPAKWKRCPRNPGCGKTMMASSVFDELFEEKKSQDPNPMVCYFFFKHTDPRSSNIEAAYRSALTQIIHRYREDSDVLDKFLFIQSDSGSSSGQNYATSKQLFDLMCLSAQTLGHINFVVDGIDEANDPNDVSDRLKVLVTTAPVRLICFSRSNISRLQYLVPAQQRIIFSRDLTNRDIRLFLDWEISDMVEEDMLPTSSDIQSLVESLLKGADGMFLWAKLMVRYLRSPGLSGRARMREIQNVRLPEGLDAVYDRIVSLIIGSSESELRLAREILLWIQYSKKLQHSFDWLYAAVGHDWDPNEKDAFVAAAVAVCNGLVEYSACGGFNFTHLTVREYFQQKSLDGSGQGVLLPQRATAMLELASRCIEHLLALAPSEPPLPHCARNIYESGETILDFHKSFEAFVTEEWVYYLSNIWILACSGGESGVVAQNITRLKATIGRFLGNPLAVGLWIENLYALKFSTETIAKSITGLAWVRAPQWHNAEKALANQLAAIAQDLQLVEREWGDKLRQKPQLIWGDVVLFSKLKILSKLDTSRFGTVSSLLPRDAENDSCNIPPLCSISSTSSTAGVTGVLTIIPSADFVQFWRSTVHSQSYTQGESFCEGWAVNYEVWSQESKTRLASLKIPLPQKEILVLFRQSFRHEVQHCLTDSEEAGVLGLNQEVTIDTENPDGRLVSFADYRKPCQVTLAVFELHLTPTLCLQCIRSTSAILGEKKVWLWDFGGISRPVHLKTNLDPCSKGPSYGGTSPDSLASLSFSVCGDFILARNTTETVVLPLPKETNSNTDRKKDVRTPKRKRSAKELGLTPSLGSLVHLASEQHLLERTLSGAHLSMAGANLTTIALIPEQNNVSLELFSQGPSGKRLRRQLVALPNSMYTKDKAITVKFPETLDEHLRITLDKNATESYTLDEDRRFSHPAVIEKNLVVAYSRGQELVGQDSVAVPYEREVLERDYENASCGKGCRREQLRPERRHCHAKEIYSPSPARERRPIVGIVSQVKACWVPRGSAARLLIFRMKHVNHVLRLSIPLHYLPERSLVYAGED